MCGINGFTWRDPGLLRRMHGATRYRGPDDEGLWETEAVSFAHNRLSIIDLSPGGRNSPFNLPGLGMTTELMKGGCRTTQCWLSFPDRIPFPNGIVFGFLGNRGGRKIIVNFFDRCRSNGFAAAL